MISKLITNVLEIGLGSLLLWALFIIMLAIGIDYIFLNIEKWQRVEHKIYWYDIITHISLVVIFVLGVYSYP